MKELSKERAQKLHVKYWGIKTKVEEELRMIQEAYTLGQQEAQEAYRLGQQEADGVDDLRLKLAHEYCLERVSSASETESVKNIAQIGVLYANSLIAELNRTASDAEKGGEHE